MTVTPSTPLERGLDLSATYAETVSSAARDAAISAAVAQARTYTDEKFAQVPTGGSSGGTTSESSATVYSKTFDTLEGWTPKNGASSTGSAASLPYAAGAAGEVGYGPVQNVFATGDHGRITVTAASGNTGTWHIVAYAISSDQGIWDELTFTPSGATPVSTTTAYDLASWPDARPWFALYVISSSGTALVQSVSISKVTTTTSGGTTGTATGTSADYAALITN